MDGFSFFFFDGQFSYKATTMMMMMMMMIIFINILYYYHYDYQLLLLLDFHIFHHCRLILLNWWMRLVDLVAYVCSGPLRRY